MEKNDDYVTIIRNGKECLVYNWSQNYTKDRFETMVEDWLGTGQGFVRNSATNEWFLIDADERVITCIKSEEVLWFMKEYVYAMDINETFIDMFLNWGKFRLQDEKARE